MEESTAYAPTQEWARNGHNEHHLEANGISAVVSCTKGLSTYRVYSTEDHRCLANGTEYGKGHVKASMSKCEQAMGVSSQTPALDSLMADNETCNSIRETVYRRIAQRHQCFVNNDDRRTMEDAIVRYDSVVSDVLEDYEVAAIRLAASSPLGATDFRLRAKILRRAFTESRD